MPKCKHCEKETNNTELIPNEKNELIEEPYCKECFEKLKKAVIV